VDRSGSCVGGVEGRMGERIFEEVGEGESQAIRPVVLPQDVVKKVIEIRVGSE